MAQKKTNKKTITIISIVVVALLIAAVVFVIIWAKNRGGEPADTGIVSVSESVSENDTESAGVVVVTDDQTVTDTTDDGSSDDSTSDDPNDPQIPEVTGNEYDVRTVSDGASGENSAGNKVTLDIKYPKLVSEEYSENAAKFNELVSTVVDDFKNAYSLSLAGEDGFEGSGDMSFIMDFQVYRQKYGTLSILIRTSTVSETAPHGGTAYKAVNYSPEGGETITLDSIFSADKETYTKFIKSYILDKMKQNSDKYFSTDNNALDDVFRPDQFVIDQNGIAVFFQEYDIAPYSEGLQMFEIPYTDMAELMAY